MTSFTVEKKTLKGSHVLLKLLHDSEKYCEQGYVSHKAKKKKQQQQRNSEKGRLNDCVQTLLCSHCGDDVSELEKVHRYSVPSPIMVVEFQVPP